MGETGRVIEKDNGALTLVLKRTEACAKCRTCVAGLSSKDMILKAKDECGASIGDFVEVELREGYFAKAALIMYGFPLVVLVVGFFAGTYLSRIFIAAHNDLIGFLAGVLFMAVSYYIISRGEKGKKAQGFTPVAVRITQPPEEQPQK